MGYKVGKLSLNVTLDTIPHMNSSVTKMHGDNRIIDDVVGINTPYLYE